jgi:hypothetical protein
MPIAVVALQLQTVNQVSLGGGPVGYYFATLDTSQPNSGVLTIDSFPSGGSPGTFHDDFVVYFDIRYGAINGPIVAEPAPLTLYIDPGDGDWWPTLPPSSPPLMHHYPDGPPPWTDLHVVTIDPDVSDSIVDGFYPVGVPEPSSLALLCCGVLSLALKTRWSQK